MAAWWARSKELADAAKRLEAPSWTRFTSRSRNGPDRGADPGRALERRRFETAWGRQHIPNVPTEEVFTSPDPERTEGVVTSTRPLLVSGRAVNGLRIRFEGGRAVEIDADEGAGLLRELVARDADANRLGEVALVDGSGRVGPPERCSTTRCWTRTPPATSPWAPGSPTWPPRGDRRAHQRSGVHTDFMIGGPEVQVTATTRDGRELPVLVDGRWAL